MTQVQIQWRQLGGIVAVQSAMTLAWVIYSLYLPDLLVQLGFQAQLAQTLLIIEHGLEAVIEPIFGNLSDRSQGSIGSRFPWITLGVIWASACFIVLPLVVLLISPVSPWRWIFPLIAVLWASGMAIFRSPVTALLGQITPPSQLPIAVSYLTLGQKLIGALRLSAYGLILSMGALFTFATGSLVLLGAATFLKKVMPPSPPRSQPQHMPPISARNLMAIIGVAITFGWGLRFLFASLGQIFTTQLGEGNWGLLGFNLLLALTAIPVGLLASHFGNVRAVSVGLIVTAILLGGLSFSSSLTLLVISTIVMSVALSTVLNGMVPFALALVPQERAGLGLGIYFGMLGGAIASFDLWFADVKNLEVQISLAVLLLIIAGCFIVVSKSYQLPDKVYEEYR